MNFRYWARQGTISNRPPGTGADRARDRQGGQALVLFAIFFTVILGTAALVLDQGLLRKANYDLYNALDAGALAGVSMLKDKPVEAEKTARKYVQQNYPGGLPTSDVTVGFRCLIGAVDGVARISDVPTVCDPGPSATWTVDGGVAYARCNPHITGVVCNTLVVSSPASIDYNFAPILGVTKGNTGARSAAACKGACGEPPEVPVDLVMILDRTGSMNGVDTENARRAADSVRKVYDPRLQWIGLGLLHRSETVDDCIAIADNRDGWTPSTSAWREWVPVGLTGKGAGFEQDYTNDSSAMAKAISCFNNSSGQGTDLADPVRMATHELDTHGRTNSVKAILLLSDGKPNSSATSSVETSKNYCADAFEAAKAAKAKGIEVYTVGFGLDIEQDHICQDRSGDWYTKSAPDLLAAMATDSANDRGCVSSENDDGDNYFCLPKTSGASTDLSEVFKKAVAQLSGHSRLVNVD